MNVINCTIDFVPTMQKYIHIRVCYNLTNDCKNNHINNIFKRKIKIKIKKYNRQ